MIPCEVNKTVVVSNNLGLHLRPADLLVRCASKFDSEILIVKDGQPVDCKSILSLLTLGAAQGTELQVITRGDDSESAMSAIVELFDNGFYELEATEPI